MSELTPYILAAALAWASGIRLYAVLFLLGLAGTQHWFELPTNLEILEHPWVLATTGGLLLLEFLADKVPGIDSVWDALHTFVRIPAGALIAAGFIGAQDGAVWALVAGLVGGSITAGTHFTKAGSRALINTSPEPFSNWGASIAEDGLLIAGLWLAFTHPLVFGLLLLLFLSLVIWLLPKLWRLITGLLARTGRLLGVRKPAKDTS